MKMCNVRQEVNIYVYIIYICQTYALCIEYSKEHRWRCGGAGYRRSGWIFCHVCVRFRFKVEKHHANELERETNPEPRVFH